MPDCSFRRTPNTPLPKGDGVLFFGEPPHMAVMQAPKSSSWFNAELFEQKCREHPAEFAWAKMAAKAVQFSRRKYPGQWGPAWYCWPNIDLIDLERADQRRDVGIDPWPSRSIPPAELVEHFMMMKIYKPSLAVACWLRR